MPADEEIVTFRLPPKDRAAIQRLIEAGEFRNRSDFLRYAVKSALDLYESRAAKARADLEIEGVELPQAGAKAARTHHPRPRRGVNL